MLFDTNESGQLPLEFLEGVRVVSFDLNLFNCDYLIVIATLVDFSSAAAADDLKQFDSVQLDHDV